MKYYKVVTKDLKSLGFRNNPTIFTYEVNKWKKEPKPTRGRGGWGGKGGIWVAKGLGNGNKLRKYCLSKGMFARLFEVEIGNVLYENSYRLKTDKVKLINEIYPIIETKYNYDGNALGGAGSIQEWEQNHGRGFWGNATTGYITDDELKKMI